MPGTDFLATVLFAPLAGVAAGMLIFTFAVRATSRAAVPDDGRAE